MIYIFRTYFSFISYAMFFNLINYLNKSIWFLWKTKHIIIFAIFNGTNMFSPSLSKSEAIKNLKLSENGSKMYEMQSTALGCKNVCYLRL